MSIALREGFVNVPLENVLEDLVTRFVINCPSEDLASIERVFFQIEEAHWFYLDFIRNINPSLPSMSMKTFSKQMIDTCPVIWKWGNSGEALARFGKYKSTIPVRGVALFNESVKKVLLIQGTESDSWSFPRGKINKDEEDWECAVRECKEEIGFNATDYINENDVVERTIRGKNYKIYLIKNVPEDFEFKPEVRNEIKNIEWRSWKKLYKKLDRRFSENSDKKSKAKKSRYFLVESMYQPINNWVQRQIGVLDEEQMKEYAESQLKILLGIGESKKHGDDAKLQIDRGRELLDLLHKNEHSDDTIKKDIPDLFQQLFGYKQPHQQPMSNITQTPMLQNVSIQQQPQQMGIQSQIAPPFNNFIPPFPLPVYNQKQMVGHPMPQFYQAPPQQIQGFPSPLPMFSGAIPNPNERIPLDIAVKNVSSPPTVNNQEHLSSKKEIDDDDSEQKQYYYQLQSHGGSVPDPEKFSKPSFDFTEIAKKKNQDDSSKKELLSILTRPKKTKSPKERSSEINSNNVSGTSYDNILSSSHEKLLSSNDENPLLKLLKQRKSFSKSASNDLSSSVDSMDGKVQLSDFFKGKSQAADSTIEDENSILSNEEERIPSSVLSSIIGDFTPTGPEAAFASSDSKQQHHNNNHMNMNSCSNNSNSELLSILQGGSALGSNKNTNNSNSTPSQVMSQSQNHSNNEFLNILHGASNITSPSLSSESSVNFSSPLQHHSSANNSLFQSQQQHSHSKIGNELGDSEKATDTLINTLYQCNDKSGGNSSIPFDDGLGSPSINGANTILKILKRPKPQNSSSTLPRVVSTATSSTTMSSSKNSSSSSKSRNSSRSGSNKKGNADQQLPEPNMHDMKFQVLKRPKDSENSNPADSGKSLLNILHGGNSKSYNKSDEIGNQIFSSGCDSSNKAPILESQPIKSNYGSSDSNYLLGLLKKNQHSANNNISGQNPLMNSFHSTQDSLNGTTKNFQRALNDEFSTVDNKDSNGSHDLLNLLHRKVDTNKSSKDEDFMSYLLK